MKISHLSNFKQRLAVSSIGVLLLLLMICTSHHPLFRLGFACFVTGIINCALWEYYQIGIAKGFSPLTRISISGASLYILSVFLSTQEIFPFSIPLIILPLLFLTFCLYYLFKESHPLANLAITSFGIIYLVLPLSLLINVNYFFDEKAMQGGSWWLIYLLTVTKMTDTGAYIIGKRFGHHKLAPHISPRKTIEGAIGGMIFGIIISIIFFILHSLFTEQIRLSITLEESIFLGIAIGIIAQIGDLIESLLKRDGGIKDSNQLPGLGGILDVVDSLVFTTPFLYFFLSYRNA